MEETSQSIVKRRQRTQEQQDYRDALAGYLKDLRKRGYTGNELAKALLDSEKNNHMYLEGISVRMKIKKLNKAKDLISRGYLFSVIEDLNSNYYSGMESDVVNAFVELGRTSDLLYDLSCIDGSKLNKYLKGLKLSKTVAKKLIRNGEGNCLLQRYKRFEKFDGEILVGLVKNLDKNKIDYRKLIHCLDKCFICIDKDTALELIKLKRSDFVLYNLKYFEGLDGEVLVKLVEQLDKREGAFLWRNLDKFEGLNNKIAEQLLDKDEWIVRNFLNVLDVFEGIDIKFVHKLSSKFPKYFISIFDKFHILFDRTTAMNIIDQEGIVPGGPSFFNGRIRRKGRFLVTHLDRFYGLDGIIADKLISYGNVYEVLRNIDKFQGINRSNLVSKLIYSWPRAILVNLKSFKGLKLSKKIAKILYQNRSDWNDMDYLVENLDCFKSIDWEVGKGMLGHRANYKDYVIANIDKFEGMDKEAAEWLEQEGQGEYVKSHPEKFLLNDGESIESSPFLLKK